MDRASHFFGLDARKFASTLVGLAMPAGVFPDVHRATLPELGNGHKAAARYAVEARETAVGDGSAA